MRYLFVSFSLILAVLLSACGPNYIYNKSYEISEEGWAYEDTLNFELEILDTMGLYNLYLELEHAPDFSFQNLYVKIHTEFPSGERLHKEVSLELAYKGGAWIGDCGSKKCKIKIPIQEKAFFNMPGQHTITLEQFMRQTPITGIKKVSFKLEATGEERTM